MRAAEEPAPEAAHRIDSVMQTRQQQLGSAFEQQLRARLGAQERKAEDPAQAQQRKNGRSRRNRKRRRR